MLYRAKQLLSYKLQGAEESLGDVTDILIDENTWNIRYLVVDVGSWFLGKEVLISNLAVTDPDWRDGEFHTSLTKKEVEDSPEIDSNPPISRQKEIELFEHYKWVPYWHTAAAAHNAYAPVPPKVPNAEKAAKKDNEDANLRSLSELLKYGVNIRDDNGGYSHDFIIGSDDWMIHYFIFDTKLILPGKKIMVPVKTIKDISWHGNRIAIDANKEILEKIPEYEDDIPFNEQYNQKFLDFYKQYNLV